MLMRQLWLPEFDADGVERLSLDSNYGLSNDERGDNDGEEFDYPIQVYWNYNTLLVKM